MKTVNTLFVLGPHFVCETPRCRVCWTVFFCMLLSYKTRRNLFQKSI